MVDEEIRRYAKVLEAVVKLSDLSTRELERRLELGGGTLNRLFTGKIDLKVRHILLVLEVVGMRPERFFQLACARPAAGEEAGGSLATEILESFQRFGYSIGQPGSAPARPPSDEELDRRIEAALERVLDRVGRVPAGAATAAAPELTGETGATGAGKRPSDPAADLQGEPSGEWPPQARAAADQD
jgi:AcrR family transcriptional regulator